MTGRNGFGLGMIAAGLMGWAQITSAAVVLTMDGWRYREDPGSFPFYTCERDDCTAGSILVFYPDTTDFHPRKLSEIPGLHIEGEILFRIDPGVVWTDTTTMHSRGEMMARNGGRITHYVISVIDRPTWKAVLLSLSSDGRTAETNLERFEAALRADKEQVAK